MIKERGFQMNTFKKIKIITVCLLIIFLITSTVALANGLITGNSAPFKIFSNNKELTFTLPIITIEDRTYVPLREFAENFDMDVEWIGSEKKINLYSESMQGCEAMISIMIFPAGCRTISYKLELFADKQLAVTVGHATPTETLDGRIIPVKASDFSLIVTRYTYLTDAEMEELENLMSKITIEEKGKGELSWGGWYVTIRYQGDDYQYRYTEGSAMREHMREIIKSLVAYSPIKITTFNYEDPEQHDYYENHDW